MAAVGKHSSPEPVAAHPAPSLLLSLGAAVLVTAVIFGSVSVADQGNGRAQRSSASSTTTTTGPPAGGASAVASQSAQPAPVPEPVPAATATATKLTRPTVELRWTGGESWVRVTDHTGWVLINDIFPRGTVKKFWGPSFYLEMGNAGAITLIDKGGKPMIAGKFGQIARCTVKGP